MKEFLSVKILLPILLSLILVSGILIGLGIANSSFSKTETQEEINKYGHIVKLLEGNYVDSVDTRELVDKSITEMVKLLDPHTSYVSIKNAAISESGLEASFEGIGVLFSILNDTLFVEYPIEQGPAQIAGIKTGDKVIAIDGNPFVGVSLNDAFHKLRGESGSEVTLTIKRRTKETFVDIVISRGHVATPSIDYYDMLSETTGYIKISKFGLHTYRQFHQILNILKKKGMNKLVIDLRDNSGGYMNDASDIINEFLRESALIVFTRGNNIEYNEEVRATSEGDFLTQPVVVLVNENSASASEIVAGALQDNDRATIIGRRTYGKGLVQRPYKLQDGSSIRITISRYYTPSGRCIQKSYASKGTYQNDYFERITSGELFNQDSIKVIDSLKFKTISGRTVYGGGGIMPDIFVPVDSSNFISYYIKCHQQKLPLLFALDYIAHHPELNKKGTLKAFLDEFKWLDDFDKPFQELAERSGVNRNKIQFEQTKELLKTNVKSYVVRELYGIEAYHQALHISDRELQVGLESFKNSDAFILK